MKRSTSNWEDSYFGGYKKVLLDYPEIRLPWQIDFDMPDHKEFYSYYSKSKLSSLFLYRVNEFGLSKIFLKDATVVERRNKYTGAPKKYLQIAKSYQKTVLDKVMTLDTELCNMFSHYRELIATTDFYFPYPEKDKEKDGEGGDGKKDKEAAEMLGEALKEALELMGKCKLLKGLPSSNNNWDENVTGELKKTAKFMMMRSLSRPTKYTKDEELHASHLVNLLDISFDPEQDRIDNLKVGKLDTGKLGETQAGNFHVYYKVEENQTTKPFSVCILCDESGSMGMPMVEGSRYYRGTPLADLERAAESCKATAQHHIVKTLYKAFSQIVPLDKMFIYGHTGDLSPEIRVYHDKYNTIFEQTIDNQINNAYCQNYDGPVIEAIYEKVRSMTDDNIIFISISDGQPSGHNYGGTEAVNDMKRIIEKCKRDGFVTVGIGVQYNGVKGIYNYHTVVNKLKDMPKQVSLLINQVVKTEFQS